MMIDFLDIKELVKLENRTEIDHPDTCFDYVDSIYQDQDYWVVRSFIEPVGNLEIRGRKLSQVLRFLSILFKTQPTDMSSGLAARHLDEYLESFIWEKPEDAMNVWMLGVDKT